MLEMEALVIAAITIAFLHTLTGPDHYVPFIALSKTRGWSYGKTISWTIFCGCGHVWSSVLLGLGGAAIGWSLSRLTLLEGIRGGIAGWAMLIFGLIYCLWGLYRAQKDIPHKHFDMDNEGSLYVFEHKHGNSIKPGDRHKVTPWVMFIIFLLGPCEPMIPLLFYPAAKGSLQNMLILIATYTFFTLVTMVCLVSFGYYGVSLLKTKKVERYMHALGGLTLFMCGSGMVFLGL